MKVYKYRLQGIDEVFLTMSYDLESAYKDICNLYDVRTEDIECIEEVVKLSSKKPILAKT